ncbi:MAG: polyphenol oxidase family protein [Acidimicrobiia bacterium]|nr:polyphenol oxidase family protein [Acidimicrobiia bacterium]
MILTPGVPGVAFGTIADGDGRTDLNAREAIAAELGISSDWALMNQVHGSRVVSVSTPGSVGEADGLATTVPMLALVAGTADCVPVGLVGDHSVAVVHAGWRGVASEIIVNAIDAIVGFRDHPHTAVIGPHIGPCCYEVGDDVVEAIGGYTSTTTWGTQSVDLAAAMRDQLGEIKTVHVGGCTRDDVRFASHRENGTKRRQVAVVWIPQD